MCGYQRSLVCSLETININTNLFDRKGISADFKHNVKMTSKPTWCGLADWNSAIKLQHNVSTGLDD